MKDEHLYLQARSEVDSTRRDPAIWDKAMSVTNNDEIVSRYAYIALRLEQLVEQEQLRNSSPSRPNSIAKEEHPLADLDGTMHTAKPAVAPAAVHQGQDHQVWETDTRQEPQRQQVQQPQQQQAPMSDAVVLSDDPTLMALPEFSHSRW